MEFSNNLIVSKYSKNKHERHYQWRLRWRRRFRWWRRKIYFIFASYQVILNVRTQTYDSWAKVNSIMGRQMAEIRSIPLEILHSLISNCICNHFGKSNHFVACIRIIKSENLTRNARSLWCTQIMLM